MISLSVLVLAGGRSTRMRSSKSKILMPIAGRPMISHVLQTIQDILSKENDKGSTGDKKFVMQPLPIVTVVPPGISLENDPETFLPKAFFPMESIIQPEAKGTADALSWGLTYLEKKAIQTHHSLGSHLLIMLGDVPLLRPEDMMPLLQEACFHEDAGLIIQGFYPPCPKGYGRILTENPDSFNVLDIIEEKNTNTETGKIPFCNTGVFLMRTDYARSFLSSRCPDPVTGEFYITDCVRHIVAKGGKVRAVQGPFEPFQGINTPIQWSQSETLFQNRLRLSFQENGVFLTDASTVFFSYDTVIQPDVWIHPYVRMGRGVFLESEVVVHSFSVLSHCHLKRRTQIGPFVHLRQGVVLEQDCTLGNFVELKNTTMGPHSQAKHLAYLGDSIIEGSCNIGAGVITCNYDGRHKHKTFIGEGSLVGSNVSLVAPLQLGKQVTVGAGSVLTKDVPNKNLSVARVQQKNIPLSENSKHLNRQEKK